MSKRYGGRQKGTPNKRTQAVIERLEAMGCDPLEGMARLAQEAEAEGDKALAGRMYGELANYVAPKRKAIEKETVPEEISLEEAKQQCIDFLCRIRDEDRQEIFKAMGLQDQQPTEEMTERRMKLELV